MRPLTLSLLQANLVWEDRDANLEMFERMIKEKVQPSQVVVLPEMFTTGFSMQPEKFAESMDGPSVAWMKSIAARKKIILTGSLIIEEEGHYYNRLIWMLPNGQYGYYDKRHLFGYAGEDQHYSPGKRKLIASVNGWRICLLVCYDLRFPVWSRNRILPETRSPEYDLIIYVANWPERRNFAWKSLLRARAIENQCYVAAVNRVGNDGNGIYHSGDSCIIDPLGEPILDIAHKEDVFTQTIDPAHLNEIRSRFPFLKDGDHFAIGL